MVAVFQKIFCTKKRSPLAVVMAAVIGMAAWSSAAAETLTLGGTGSSLGTMHRLADAYMARNPGTEISVLPSLGSGGGIKAVIDGSIDISMSGRDLKDKERQAGVESRIYARCPFIFVVHPENPVSDLTLDDLVKIFTGEISAWPDGSPLRLILRPERESDVDFLKSLSPEMEKAVAASYTRQGMIVAVTDQETGDKLEHVPGALGVSTLCQIVSEQRRLKGLTFNGIRPTLENLETGQYPHFRDLRFITRSDPPEAVRKFLGFVFSEEGAEILKQNGNQPVKTP